jgi:hypothetical protein
VIVTPDTVPRWQRRRFREHWAKLSGRPTVGRPPVNADIIALVRTIAAANPLWGAPRIHGELLQLGIEVAERTASRLIPKRPTPVADLAHIPREPCPGPARSRHCPQRAPPASRPDRLLRVLPAHPNAPLPYQRCTGREAGQPTLARHGCLNPRSRWTASSLHPARGVAAPRSSYSHRSSPSRRHAGHRRAPCVGGVAAATVSRCHGVKCSLVDWLISWVVPVHAARSSRCRPDGVLTKDNLH